MKANELLNLLFESSTLRNDLLKKAEKSVKNVFDNIELTDELCARVDEETYEFISDYKLGN